MCSLIYDFYPRPPRGGRRLRGARFAVTTISTHALREEGDYTGAIKAYFDIDISTHALREEGDAERAAAERAAAISTHALREEGDMRRCPTMRRCSISTHALREEGDMSIPTM